MNKDMLLPIGSIVLVKEADKKMMIIGILQQADDITYDYMALPYPEGYMDAETIYLFNHEDLASIEFLGYMDAEYQLFRSSLSELLEDDSVLESFKEESDKNIESLDNNNLL